MLVHKPQRASSLEAIAGSEINTIHFVSGCVQFRVERGGKSQIIVLLSQLTAKQQHHGLTYRF